LHNDKPYLGVAPYQDGLEIRRSTWSAPVVAVGVMKDFTIATFKGLGTALKGLGSLTAGFFSGNKVARQAGQQQAGSQVSGPVGIFTVLYEISKQGFGLVLFVIAILSLTLAIMNVLPIPALDGGRLFVMLVYRTLKKPLEQKTEERIHGTGFAVLMLLFVVITVVDIRRFF
jgi:regulator of sigma E protease